MKSKEKSLARILRSRGYSMKEISRKLSISKSTVSLWVGDIELTPEQKRRLSEKGVSKAVIEQRRATRLTNENARRQLIVDAAKEQIKDITFRELWLIGVMLYWAEGGKTLRGVVRFSNSDPEMIRIMMVFLRKVCRVPEYKFRGHIHIHPHLNYKKAEHYWVSVSGIRLEKFYKTYRKMNKASKHKRDSLPYGTFDIYVCSTELFLKISGWAQGIWKSYGQILTTSP